jgi:hypothetical protein
VHQMTESPRSWLNFLLGMQGGWIWAAGRRKVVQDDEDHCASDRMYAPCYITMISLIVTD